MGKLCRLCGLDKPIEEFYVANGTRDGRRGECKACFQAARKAKMEADPALCWRAVERTQAWRDANRERFEEVQRRWIASGGKARANRRSHLRRKYGITVEEYDEQLAAQRGCCALCEATPSARRPLHVDHNHATGRIRGLLCFDCNAAIGLLEENVEVMARAIEYLAPNRADTVAAALVTRRGL
jgi:hypothetical protein